ncbi:MAG: TonB-dependent receptor [Bacteroidota bacterium]
MKRPSILLTLIFLIGLILTSHAQELTQTVRGKVVDKETGFPLIGARVWIDGTTIGKNTNDKGEFRLESVPVGRQTVLTSYIGYAQTQQDVEVTSGKEVVLEVGMPLSAVEVEGATIVAGKAGDAQNDVALVSARGFTVAETNLYAGSRGEPARMASNFAGVQGGDDSRNDLVIRGNTPNGVLWRLEGINIPNPNHFVIPGTGGGSVTILNNKFLANSDFYTGAFPSEFGNGIAGVFDLRMRNGNNQQHEFTGQLGFLGTEFTAEGPIGKNSGASYLAMYRYSTLALFSFLNVDVGTDAIPRYQDGAFRFNFPTKNGGNIALWGMGGISDIDIILSGTNCFVDDPDLFASSQDRDQYFGSNTFVSGLTLNQPFSASSSLRATVAYSHQRVDANHDQIYQSQNEAPNCDSGIGLSLDSLPPILDYTFAEDKISANVKYTRRFSPKHTLYTGFTTDYYFMNYTDSARTVLPQGSGPNVLLAWRTRWNAQDENAILFQPYVQYKWKPNDKFQLVAGLTSLYWSLNDSSFSPIEPRLAMSYNLGKGQKLSFGSGLHSQIQSPYLNYYSNRPNTDGSLDLYNLDLGLTKSFHVVMGYDRLLGKATRFKTEVYYQYLYNIPSFTDSLDAYSLINAGSGFSRFFPGQLADIGTGRNYGWEVTLERFFRSRTNGGYYFLFTGSLFDSKFRGSDGILNNTTFNGRYAVNVLFSREWIMKKGVTLNVGGKFTTVGGRWRGEVDDFRSARDLEVIFRLDSTFNTIQFPAYLRLDGRVSIRWNRKRVTHELAIDLVNFTGRENALSLIYVPNNPVDPVQQNNQLGFLPLFYYKIDFFASGKN